MGRVGPALAFVQLAAASREQGSGLGMALCKELVELLGGRIAVRSALSLGTSVEVLLPLRTGPLTQDASRA